jgi:hypothetical protein
MLEQLTGHEETDKLKESSIIFLTIESLPHTFYQEIFPMNKIPRCKTWH